MRLTIICLISFGLVLGACSSGDKTEADYGVWLARIESQEQLIGGRTARARIGDYKIWNRQVAFTIQDVGLASGYRRYGGGVADGDVFDADGNPLGASQLGEVFFGFNQRLFEPQVIELIPATAETGRATIRVSGQDAFFEWLGAYLANILPMGPIDSNLTFDYSLGAEDQALRIEVEIENRGAEQLILDMPELVSISGDGLKPFFEGPGFEGAEHVGSYDSWLALGDRLSYGIVAEDGPVRMFLNISNIAFGVFPKIIVRPGRSERMVRHLAVVDGGLEKVQRVLRRIGDGESVGRVVGRVTASQEALDLGVRIHVQDQQAGQVTMARVDAGGEFELELPGGEYLIWAKADGHDPSEAYEVSVSDDQDSQLNMDLPPATLVSYRIRDGQAELSPGRLVFIRQDGAAANIMPGIFGEEYYGYGNAARVEFSASGEGQLWLPAGTYELVASRGTEFEVDRQTVVLLGGQEQVQVELLKVVDSTGYLSGDFHVHGQYSPDSSVDPLLRVRTALSEGLDLLIMTEHDTVRSFADAVASVAGASERIKPIVASEITTYMYGHFNSWPLTEKPDQINHGGIEWFETAAPDLFERMRQSEDHPVVIQVNHPRTTSVGGYFSAVGLDIRQGTYSRADWWSDNFDAIEVFNGGCSNGGGEIVQDWFDFLNRGYPISVGGGSDSHYEYHTLGLPRVYVKSDKPAPQFLAEDLVPNFVGQQVFVSCGPFVRFSIDGQGSGSLLSSQGPLEVWIQVQAPSWMDLSEIRIIRNGQVVWSAPAQDWPEPDGALRFDDIISLDPDGDAWYVLEVTGSGSNRPVSNQTPYAITNPIYLDYNGNGVFDPPLPPYRLAQ